MGNLSYLKKHYVQLYGRGAKLNFKFNYVIVHRKWIGGNMIVQYI